ncbi:MAG: hypothetical protein IPI61_14860 [Syntrophaceae bacterium]|nr:hypothetical protein [Syntrophaceae bacterium]
MNLTPRELQVASLIKEGRTTKEIAEFLNVTPSAVNICRHGSATNWASTTERSISRRTSRSSPDILHFM